MKPRMRITRHPYEEPHAINLVFELSNERTCAQIEVYLDASELLEWAGHLELFPRHSSDVFLIEIGSERPEDRWGYYFRFRAFQTDSKGHCALQFRLNNNEDLPAREIAEFCIEAEASQINKLGRLVREYGRLRHSVLDWWVEDGTLFETVAEAQPIVPGDAAR